MRKRLRRLNRLQKEMQRLQLENRILKERQFRSGTYRLNVDDHFNIIDVSESFLQLFSSGQKMDRSLKFNQIFSPKPNLEALVSGDILFGQLSFHDFFSFPCKLSAQKKDEFFECTLEPVLSADEDKKIKDNLIFQIQDAYALHELIYDENQNPVDYRFLDVNPAFEIFTGLEGGNMIGRTVREIIPDIEDFWIESYAKVVESGESIHFENYSAPLEKYYLVHAYKVSSNRFVTLFQDTTETIKKEMQFLRQQRELEMVQKIGNILSWQFIPKTNELTFFGNHALVFEGIENLEIRRPEDILKILDDTSRLESEKIFENLEKHGQISLELSYLTDQNERRWFDAHIKAMRNEKQEIVKFFGLLQNIHERKMMEIHLQESKRRHRMISELTADIAFIIFMEKGKSQSVEWISGDCEKFTAGKIKTLEEVKDWIDLIHPKDRDYFLKEKMSVLETRLQNKIEYRITDATGKVRFVQDISFPEADENGEIIRVYQVINDITQKKESAKALLQSEKRFSRIFENNSVPMAILLGSGVFVDINQSFVDHFGFSKEDLIGSEIGKLNFDSHRGKIDAKTLFQFQKNRLQNHSCHFLTPLGTKQVFLSSDSFSIGEEQYLSLSFEDLTDVLNAQNELEEAKILLESLVHQAPVGLLLILEPDKKIRIWNERLSEILGMEHKDFSYQDYKKLNLNYLVFDLKGEMLNEKKSPIHKALQGKIFKDEVVRIKRKDGSKIWVKIRAFPVLKKDSKPFASAFFFEDVTEEHRARMALVQSEAWLSTVLNNVPAMIYATDEHERYYLVNRACAEFYSIPKEEFLGKKISDVRSMDQLPAVLEMNRSVIEEGYDFRIEEEALRREKMPTLYFQTRLLPLEIPGTHKKLNLGVSVDVTERRAAEEQLSKYLTLLETLMNTIPYPILYKDLQGNCLGCNNAFTYLIAGCSRKEIIGRKAVSVYSDKSFTALHMENDQKCIENKMNVSYEIKTRLATGKEAHLIVKKSPMKMRSDKIIGIVTVLVDVTEIREEEEKRVRRFQRIEKEQSVLLYIARMQEVVFGAETEAVKEILESATEVLDAEFAMKWTYDQQKNTFDFPLIYQNKKKKYIHFEQISKPAFHSLLQPRSLSVINVHQSTDLSKEEIDFFRTLEIRSFLNAPVLSEGKICGGLLIAEKKGRNWDNDEKMFVSDLANILSLTIANQKRRESEELFRLIVENQTEMVCKTTPSGVFLYASPRYCDTFGFEQDEILGKTFVPLVHPDDQAKLEEALIKVQEPPYYSSVEEQAKTVMGWRWQSWSNRGLPDEKGVVREVVSVGRDITAQKEAEFAIRNSESRYRSLIELSPDPVFLIDFDQNGLIVEVNEVACHQLQYSRKELLKLSYFEVAVGTQEMKKEIESFLTDSAKDYFVIPETKHRRKNAESYSVEVRIAKMNPDSNDQTLIAFCHDLTDRKRLEEELIQTQKMDSIGRLAGGVAHDFNNMLTPILGYIEMLLKSNDIVQDFRQPLQDMKDAASRARDLTQQLLAFGRKQLLRLEPVHLNEVLSNTKKILRRMIRENVHIRFSTDKNLAWVQADPTRLEQIIFNLAVNAQDAMKEGGTLKISTRNLSTPENDQACEFVELIFEDTGVGIPEDLIEKIFDPFFTTKGVNEGTGLGLATVYGIVKQHKGEISVESELGKGTKFTIRFPKASAPKVISEIDSVEPIKTRFEGSGILVLEDEEVIRKMSERILKQLGFIPFMAENYSSAESLLEEHPEIRLLITDVVMPDKSGPNSYTELKKISPNLKVLYMSGYVQDVVFDQGVLIDQNAFIQKPFSLSELSKKIEFLLSEA